MPIEYKTPYPVPAAGIKDDAVTSAKISDGAIVNTDIATAAAIAYSKLATDPRMARIKTGTYTGDGSTSQAITGVGFQPMIVVIQERAAGTYSLDLFMLTSEHPANTCTRIGTSAGTDQDALVSLDSDGFTVDDGGDNDDPNKSNITYWYCALG